MERRDFLKSVGALFAATAVSPHLNLIAQNIEDAPVAELPPVPQTRTEVMEAAKKIIKGITPEQLIAAAAEIPHDPGRYGFSYDQIFERVKIFPGERPEFPLDFFAPGNLPLPRAIMMNKEKEMVAAKGGKDYLMLEWADFTGDPAQMSKRFTREARWDVVGMWVQEIQHNFQAKVAHKAWECLMAAADDRNIVVKTDDDWLDGLRRKIAVTKTAMRKNGPGNSSSIRRGMCTDIFVPTQTYHRFQDHLEEKFRDEKTSDLIGFKFYDKWDKWNPSTHKIAYNGVNVCHAPELSWWEKKKDFGMACDLSRRDTSVIVMKDDPMMFHKDLGYDGIEGFAWQDMGMAVLDSRMVMMVQ